MLVTMTEHFGHHRFNSFNHFNSSISGAESCGHRRREELRCTLILRSLVSTSVKYFVRFYIERWTLMVCILSSDCVERRPRTTFVMGCNKYLLWCLVIWYVTHEQHRREQLVATMHWDEWSRWRGLESTDQDVRRLSKQIQPNNICVENSINNYCSIVNMKLSCWVSKIRRERLLILSSWELTIGH